MSVSYDLPVLPDVLKCLTRNGDPSRVTAMAAVSGGCIHHVVHFVTEKRAYLLKWNPNPLPGVFETEATGLQLLAATGTVRVPQVIATHRRPDFILLEWIQADDNTTYWDQERMGEQLAALHQHPAGERYGLDQDNYIGSTPQRNAWRANWLEFFRDCRLAPQMELAVRNALLPHGGLRKLTWLIAHLERWIDLPNTRPSLLHGDLWGGNVISGPGRQPVLIDPAVYYGEREAELAFTELFGGFTRRFYQAYEAVWPLDPGYRERRDLYNLYHLLNHLNIFGQGYAGSVAAILDLYAGA